MSVWPWLLLPLAAVAGWLVASNRFKQDNQEEQARPDIPLEYLQGLGFLIDQEHDKATEIFIRLFEADSNTVDTHFVLGNLFRQKGEIEKAIRIHQNIIARPKLDNYYRTAALFELGRDYFSLGFLDRAEKFFNHALSMKVERVKVEAYSYLVSLYEVEENWEEAIKIAQKLRKRNISGYSDRISHYYCELAEQAMQKKDYTTVRKLLAQVKIGTTALMRAAMLKGDVAFERGEISTAEKWYTQTFVENPEYAKLLLPKIRKVLSDMNASKFSDYLKKLKPKVTSTSYLLAYSQSLLDSGRVDEVIDLFSELIEQRCMPLLLVRLYLEYKASSGTSNEPLIGDLIKSLAANELAEFSYQCSNCGLKTHQLYWRCPSCSYWGTSQPRDVVSPPSQWQQGEADEKTETA